MATKQDKNVFVFNMYKTVEEQENQIIYYTTMHMEAMRIRKLLIDCRLLYKMAQKCL